MKSLNKKYLLIGMFFIILIVSSLFVSGASDLSSNWLRNHPITINGSMINGTHTNFPILITNKQLSNEVWNSSNPNHALSNGCDIRFSEDEEGNIELPLEVVNFSMDNPDGSEIWISMNLTNQTNKTFYVWYGNPSASCYSPNDTYGSDNVWKLNQVGVWHKGGADDSSPNHFDNISLSSSPTLVSGKVGKAVYYDGNDCYSYGDVAVDGTSEWIAEFWFNSSTLDNAYLTKWGANDALRAFSLQTKTGDLFYSFGNGVAKKFIYTTDDYITTGNYEHMVVKFDNGVVSVFQNGVKVNQVDHSSITTTIGDVADPFEIGCHLNAGQYTTGYFDEINIYHSNLDATYFNTRYNMMNNIELFSYAGTPQSPIETTPPTYSQVQINNTEAGKLTKFSILVDDNLALNPAGQYIFSTNNSGVWTNDSAVNFTTTPQWANVTKLLTNSSGAIIGYRWYLKDNAGNKAVTPIYTFKIGVQGLVGQMRVENADGIMQVFMEIYDNLKKIFYGDMKIIGELFITGKTTIDNDTQINGNLNLTNNLSADIGMFNQIGIKTTSPKIELDVNGSSRFNGDVNITGLINHEPIQMIGYATQPAVPSSAEVWQNITFNTSMGYLNGINFGGANNDTLLINHNGWYEIVFQVNLIDYSATPSGTPSAVRIINNGTEIEGSYYEFSTTKQYAVIGQTKVTRAYLHKGDNLKMQWIASNSNIHLNTTGRYSDRVPAVAEGMIRRIG